MLLAIYQQRGDLPNSNIDLYKQGCRASARTEQKPAQFGPPRKSHAGQRCVSPRIAAATILGNRFAAWTGPSRMPPEDIHYPRLVAPP